MQQLPVKIVLFIEHELKTGSMEKRREENHYGKQIRHKPIDRGEKIADTARAYEINCSKIETIVKD